MVKRRANVDNISNKKLDAILDEFKEDAPEVVVQSGANTGPAFLVAIVMAAVPAYLYTTAIFEMDPASNAVLYVAVTAVTTFLLALAYNKTNESEFEKLARNMKKAKGVSMARTKALSWSLFITNAIYLTLFLFLSRYALPRFPLEVSAQVNYALAVTAPAALLAARAMRYF